jgi:acetyl-CoA C-acetyltransferase
MASTEVHIVAARRSPIGRLGGSLASLPAHALGAAVLRKLLEDSGLAPGSIDEVILGQVLAAGAGMNPARQAARGAGLPDACTAFGVNQVCGSGLRAVALAAQQIRCGDAQALLAGGQESMSQAPHFARLRGGRKLGDLPLVDSILHDGLRDAFHDCAMGDTVQALATRLGITRESQDAFALESQLRAVAAQREGRFSAEIVPIRIGDKQVLEDEHPRADSSLAKLAALAPAFAEGGTVTAGNASGINDGAAAVLLLSDALRERQGLPSLARVVAWATAGVAPMDMGLGPVPAVRKALQQADWPVDSVDLWEINEAFAAQSIAVMQELGLDAARVNVNGGAIALGHPIGASGARILVTLLHELQRRKLRRGVASLCIGGGMGVALCVERS